MSSLLLSNLLLDVGAPPGSSGAAEATGGGTADTVILSGGGTRPADSGGPGLGALPVGLPDASVPTAAAGVQAIAVSAAAPGASDSGPPTADLSGAINLLGSTDGGDPSATTTPPSAVPAQAAPAGGGAVGTSYGSGAALSPGVIRPLTMAPPAQETQSAASPTGSGAGSGAGASGAAMGAISPPTSGTGTGGNPALTTMFFGTGSGGSGGSGGGGTLTLSTSGEAIIGGIYTASVVWPGKQLTSATYTVAGAEQSQSYTNLAGTTTDLPVPVVHNLNGVSMSDALNFYWNATPGNHAISVSVTCTDGSQGTVSTNVGVTNPTVTNLSFDYGPYIWAAIGTSVGFKMSDPPNDMTYHATVSEPAGVSGGTAQWTFIQKVNFRMDNTCTTAAGVSTDYVWSSPGWVLDNQPDKPNDGDAGYPLYDGPYTVLVGGSSDGSPLDQPQWHITQNATSGPCTDLKSSIQFNDYVVFKPNGGIWVQVAATTTTLTLSGEEKLNADGTWSAVAGPSPAASGSVPWANPSYGLLSWNNYATKYINGPSNPPFPN